MVNDSPVRQTPSSARYKFAPQTLKPEDAVYLQLPDGMSKRDVMFMVLGHRQNPSKENGWDASKKWVVPCGS